MYIRELHISGFGIFHNKDVPGFLRGLNVLYGPNEIGKSTLLAFIRRCLFGFPRASSAVNPYPPLAGGAYGGRLVCTLDNGADLVVSRNEGPRGGRLEALYNNRTISDQQELSALLGNMSRNLYNNVYGIGLAELEQIKSLDSDEIRDRLYGAELGLGRASITETRRKTEQAANGLFKQRGSSQVIPRIFRDIESLRTDINRLQTELSSYDDYYSQREGLQKRLADLDSKLTELDKVQRSLETQKNLYSEHVSYKNAIERHDSIPDLGSFHESVIDQLENLQKAAEDAEADARDKTASVEDVQARLDGLQVNDALLEKEASITALSRLSDKYQSVLDDMPTVQKKREDKQKSIERRIAAIGEPLTFETVSSFSVTAKQSEELDQLSDKLRTADKRISDIRNKLEVHEEAAAEKAGSRLQGPRGYRFGVASIGIISAASLITGIVFGNSLLSVASVIVGAVAGVLSVLLKWGAPLEAVDSLKGRLIEKQDQEEANVKLLEKSLVSLLSDIGLPIGFGPTKAKEVIAEISRLQEELGGLEEYDQRLKAMRDTLQSGNELYDEISLLFGETQLSGKVVADITVISQELDTQKTNKVMLRELQEELRTAKLSLKNSNEKASLAHLDVDKFIKTYGVNDESSLRKLGDLFVKLAEARSDIEKAQHTIQSSVGIGEGFDNFLATMNDRRLDAIEEELHQVVDDLGQQRIERDSINQEIGALTTKIDDLSFTSELLDKQMQLEAKMEQLNRATHEWVSHQVALTMLNAAVAKYEETRQPDVIRSASGVFATVTGNAYTQVRKPLQDPELEVLTATSEKRKVSELSRGTVEQLFLAMRMGLIENYERQAERMPVIVDDILVNFDDKRAILAAQALASFSENRQVIVLTCHSSSRDSLLGVGACEVGL